jgi:hypothetical protein
MAVIHIFLVTLVALVVAVKGAKSPAGVDIDKIIDSCYDYLESHLCQGHKWGKPFHFYQPSLEKYTADQWLWDSGSHMIVWSQKNVTNAVLDLRTMLQFQQPDGRIPEQIYWSNRTAKEDAELLLMYSNIQFTGILYLWQSRGCTVYNHNFFMVLFQTRPKCQFCRTPCDRSTKPAAVRSTCRSFCTRWWTTSSGGETRGILAMAW